MISYSSGFSVSAKYKNLMCGVGHHLVGWGYSGSHLKATIEFGIVKEGHIGKMKSVVPKNRKFQGIRL
jgi:hypothetical protein